MTAVTITVVM